MKKLKKLNKKLAMEIKEGANFKYYNVSTFMAWVYLLTAIALFVILLSQLSIIISTLLLFTFLFLFGKSLFMVSFESDRLVLMLRGKFMKGEFSLDKIDKITITKVMMTRRYNVQLKIKLKQKSTFDYIPDFEVPSTKSAKELIKFLEIKKVNYESNLDEYFN